jgi:calcineurin-like phosphoesterase family protein
MNIYLISDTHFGHELIKHLGVRGDDYESEMLNSWNKQVENEDVVIHLGDVAFKGTTALGQTFNLLPGRKILVRGNHDGGIDRYYKLGFDFVCESSIINYKGREILFTHKPQYRSSRLNIHGHLHGDDHRLEGALEWYQKRNKDQYIDMAPEIWGNRVVSIKEVLKQRM